MLILMLSLDSTSSWSLTANTTVRNFTNSVAGSSTEISGRYLGDSLAECQLLKVYQFGILLLRVSSRVVFL